MCFNDNALDFQKNNRKFAKKEMKIMLEFRGDNKCHHYVCQSSIFCMLKLFDVEQKRKTHPIQPNVVVASLHQIKHFRKRNKNEFYSFYTHSSRYESLRTKMEYVVMWFDREL